MQNGQTSLFFKNLDCESENFGFSKRTRLRNVDSFLEVLDVGVVFGLEAREVLGFFLSGESDLDSGHMSHSSLALTKLLHPLT